MEEFLVVEITILTDSSDAGHLEVPGGVWLLLEIRKTLKRPAEFRGALQTHRPKKS